MATEATRLDDLAAVVGADLRPASSDADVSGVEFDSREVTPGDLFACVPGGSFDGHDYADAAVTAGAVAVLCERPLDVTVPQLVVASVREAIGPVARAVYGSPDDAMDIIGVTGTNGKTTTTIMVESVLASADRVPGLIGTIETRIAGVSRPVRHTTPEAPELYELLADMADSGIDTVVMEVSSHALDQHRVGGLRFGVAAFTNLTQDHLDYHGDMESYFAAKAAMFMPDVADRAVINVDDEYGCRLVETCRDNGIPVVTYTAEGAAADVGVTVTAETAASLTLEISGMNGPESIVLGTGGTFNASNAACAAAIAVALGIAPRAVKAGLEGMRPVPGRFEPVVAGQSFGVVVDYAHTPDGVENVLGAARSVVGKGRLIVVIGCGGDRDRAKRPLMGAAAARLADRVIVTSDNPRSEDPLQIIDEIMPGVRAEGASAEIEPDRRKAIALAFASAEAGDLVVIAGKGHETGQEIAGEIMPFDDRDVARSELSDHAEARL